MAPNIIGVGLLVAGVIFLIMGGVVVWILGVICVLGGVGALDDLAAQATRRDLTQIGTVYVPCGDAHGLAPVSRERQLRACPRFGNDYPR
jgi:hypothetical protein